MKYKKILLTGSSGKLGTAIMKSGYFHDILSPKREVMDITNLKIVSDFFQKNDFDAIIHCAALARMKECQNDPARAIQANIIGTANLVAETIKKEKKSGKSIRFVYISTDGVYSGTKGNYSEEDAAIPYNIYGWTKLGGECSVNALSNFCIIRTSFFDPENLKFEASATDAYSSKVPINYLVKAIAIMLENEFVGTINIGSERIADYERYKQYKPSLKPCKFNDILTSSGIPLAKDASLDSSLWRKIESNNR